MWTEDTIFEDRILVSEGINLKGNVDLLTEPQQVEHLLTGINQNVTHRTRPVKDKDQAVILTVRNDSDFFEQVFVVLVGVKFRCAQDTSASSRRT